LTLFNFTNWRNFAPTKNLPLLGRWLHNVGDEAQAVFRAGMTGAHSGLVYRKRGGRLHQASAPNEYPANDSGRLLASMRKRKRKDEVTIGTTAAHGRYLRSGTSRMRRRKMSDNALLEGGARARQASRGWVVFRRLRERSRQERSLNG